MPETQEATLTINVEEARDITAGLRGANSFFGSVARTPQEVFARVNELKDQLKEKKNELKDCWLQNPDYERVEKEIEMLHEKRLALRQEINAMYPELIETIDVLKLELKSEKELFTDMMVAKTMKGESIELRDQYEQPCLPFFNVKMVAVKK